MSPRSILITGANRGLGFELAKQFLASSNPPEFLIATCRNIDQAMALKDLAKQHPNVKILELEVTNYDQFESFAKQVWEIVGEDNGLNLLINNAGVTGNEATLSDVTIKAMRDCFEVNCMAPLLLTRSLLPLLQRAADKNANKEKSANRAAVVSITTFWASIETVGDDVFLGVQLPRMYGYRCSKTALNMATKCLSQDLKNSGILVTLLHPGWVKTDMGGSEAALEISDSVRMMIERIQSFGEENNGEYVCFDGSKIPW